MDDTLSLYLKEWHFYQFWLCHLLYSLQKCLSIYPTTVCLQTSELYPSVSVCKTTNWTHSDFYNDNNYSKKLVNRHFPRDPVWFSVFDNNNLLKSKTLSLTLISNHYSFGQIFICHKKFLCVSDLMHLKWKFWIHTHTSCKCLALNWLCLEKYPSS